MVLFILVERKSHGASSYVNIKIRGEDEHRKPPQEIIQMYSNLWNDQGSLSMKDMLIDLKIMLKSFTLLFQGELGARIQKIRFDISSGIDGNRTRHTTAPYLAALLNDLQEFLSHSGCWWLPRNLVDE